jgi:hypothetical protein
MTRVAGQPLSPSPRPRLVIRLVPHFISPPNLGFTPGDSSVQATVGERAATLAAEAISSVEAEPRKRAAGSSTEGPPGERAVGSPAEGKRARGRRARRRRASTRESGGLVGSGRAR